jgi:iron complex outermembrane recepter protein
LFVFSNPGFRQNRFGYYAQDLIDLTERWKLFGSMRLDTVNQVYVRETTFGGFPSFPLTRTEDTFNHFSPRAGVIYEIVPGAMSTYGSFTQSFSPPGGGNFGTQPFLPELGEMWEGGLKMNIYEDLTLNVAGFYIERENVSTLVSTAPLTFVQTGQQRSKGVEVNLVGNWTDRLSTVTNYTYNDVRQGGAPGVPEINGRVRGVPLSLANAWTRYNVIQDCEKTLGVGLGWVYVGDRRGDYDTPLVLPSYNRWDAGVFGQWGRWNMSTYVENVFDIQYATGSIDQYQVYPGAPVNFRMQIGASF